MCVARRFERVEAESFPFLDPFLFFFFNSGVFSDSLSFEFLLSFKFFGFSELLFLSFLLILIQSPLQLISLHDVLEPHVGSLNELWLPLTLQVDLLMSKELIDDLLLLVKVNRFLHVDLSNILSDHLDSSEPGLDPHFGFLRSPGLASEGLLVRRFLAFFDLDLLFDFKSARVEFAV